MSSSHSVNISSQVFFEVSVNGKQGNTDDGPGVAAAMHQAALGRWGQPWAARVATDHMRLVPITGWISFIDEWAGSNININYDVEYF